MVRNIKFKKMYVIGTVITSLVFGGTIAFGASMNNFTVKNAFTDSTFKDIQSNQWYAKDVKVSYELGIVGGKGESKFDPQGSITIAEAITLASKVHNIYNDGNGVITNTGTNWYDGAVSYAVKNNIIKENEYKNFDKAATRAEVAYIFSNALPTVEYKLINDILKIPDVSSSTPYSENIFKLYKAGIISGSDKYGTFHPNDNITRAEASAIINRVVKQEIEKNSN